MRSRGCSVSVADRRGVGVRGAGVDARADRRPGDRVPFDPGTLRGGTPPGGDRQGRGYRPSRGDAARAAGHRNEAWARSQLDRRSQDGELIVVFIELQRASSTSPGMDRRSYRVGSPGSAQTADGASGVNAHGDCPERTGANGRSPSVRRRECCQGVRLPSRDTGTQTTTQTEGRCLGSTPVIDCQR